MVCVNKVGVHFAVFAESYADEQLQYIVKARETGFDLLEIDGAYIVGLDSARAETLKAESERQGITLVGSMGLPVGCDIGSPDAAERERGKEFLTKCAVNMQRAGIKECSGLVHSAWNGKITELAEKPVYWENSVKSMQELCRVFADNGVIFNVEVVNRFENFLINTCAEANQYLDAVGSANLGLHLDTFHMNIEENSFVEAINQAGSRLNHFHIGENNRKMPGLGMLPWREIFSALKVIGYTGPVSMEPFVKAQGDIAKAVSLYHDLMEYDKVEEAVRQSGIFVRNLLVDIMG